MFTTAGLTSSMTSANEPGDAWTRAAVFCAIEWSLNVTKDNASTPAPTAPASQPKRVERFHDAVIEILPSNVRDEGDGNGAGVTRDSRVSYGFVMPRRLAE